MRSTVEAAASAMLSERTIAIRFGTNSPIIKVKYAITMVIKIIDIKFAAASLNPKSCNCGIKYFPKRSAPMAAEKGQIK